MVVVSVMPLPLGRCSTYTDKKKSLSAVPMLPPVLRLKHCCQLHARRARLARKLSRLSDPGQSELLAGANFRSAWLTGLSAALGLPAPQRFNESNNFFCIARLQ